MVRAICGMVEAMTGSEAPWHSRGDIMLGTTTPGALRCKTLLEGEGLK
jgi:hypothetical protein